MKLDTVCSFMPVVYAANGLGKERAAWEELRLVEAVITAATVCSREFGDMLDYPEGRDLRDSLTALRAVFIPQGANTMSGVIALQAYQWWEIILVAQLIGWPIAIVVLYCVMFRGNL